MPGKVVDALERRICGLEDDNKAKDAEIERLKAENQSLRSGIRKDPEDAPKVGGFRKAIVKEDEK
jgi:cell division protein FtsB